MPMNHTRNTLHLSRHGQPPDMAVTVALEEVTAAEELTSILRELCEAHWKGSTRLDMHTLVRRAESLLPKVGG